MLRTPLSRAASILLIFGGYFAGQCHGQFALQAGRGFVIPHRAEMWRQVTGHSTGIEGSWGKMAEGAWAFENGRRGAWQGIAVSWVDPGGESLGNYGTAIWLTRLRLTSLSSVRMGAGLGYTTRPYDPVEAPDAFALGSAWNIALHVGLEREFSISTRATLLAGLAFTHLSNGSALQPNLGTNQVAVRLGLRAGPSSAWSSTPTHRQAPEISETLALQWAVGLRSGIRDTGYPGHPFHVITTLRTTVLRSLRRNRGIGAAVDLTYNQSLRASAGAMSPTHRVQAAVLIGGQWRFGKASLHYFLGYHVLHPDPSLGWRHTTVGLHYALLSNLEIFIALRSYTFRADHPQVGVTWRI